jgi:hypothetical protein
MLDVWFDRRKTMSVQWDHEEPIDVRMFKPGEWEGFIVKALSEAESERMPRPSSRST